MRTPVRQSTASHAQHAPRNIDDGIRSRLLRRAMHALLVAHCGIGSGALAAPPLTLDFARVPGTRAFDVRITAPGVTPDMVEVRANQGEVGPVQSSAGQLSARIDPARTGRLEVTVAVPAKQWQAARTALVLGHVSDDWDQPEPVQGLVNTPAWEDGPAVSLDGRWLAVHYLPVSFSCIAEGKPDNPLCRRTRGPVTGPQRPGMPGANRVGSGGELRNACPSVGVEQLDIPLPPTSLYVFARAADGSFGEPQPVYWDGVDGCVTPYGPALFNEPDGSLSLLYAFDSPADGGKQDSHGDLFAVRLDPKAPRAVGRTESRDGKLKDVDVQGHPLGRPSNAHAANPEAWRRPDGRVVVFYDDENVRDDLFYTESSAGLFDGEWSEERKIPAPVSVPGTEESQPFFDGEALYFRRDRTLLRSRYLGGDMSREAAWATPERVLDGDRRARGAGEIVGVGEPTIAGTGAERQLYFLFAEQDADGSLNFDVGRVAQRATAGDVTATPAAGTALPIESMQGIEGNRKSGMRTNVDGAQGGRALVWEYRVTPNAGALLLLPEPGVPATSASITLSARADRATTLGLMVAEKSGARYAVQVPWPAGSWQRRTFQWQEFERQSHGANDPSGRLEPEQINALLVIDASGYQGQSGDRTLAIDGLLLDAAP